MKTPWQRTIVDESGNVLPGATITVKRESTGANAVIFADEAGSQLQNPFTADAEGFARFYADGGTYQITATSGAFSKPWRGVALGSLQGFDAGPADGQLQSNAENRGEFLAKAASIKEVAATTYTLLAADNGTIIRFTSATDVTVTVPETGLINGWQALLQKAGDGNVILSPAGAATITSPGNVLTINQPSDAAAIVHRSAGNYDLFLGDGLSVPAGTDITDIMQWDGSGWVRAINPLRRLGWINIVDEVYTSASRKVIAGAARTLLDITTGLASDTASAPDIFPQSWDDVASKLQPAENGDAYMVRLSMTVNATAGTAPYIDIEGSIDEDAVPKDIILQDTVFLAKGSTVPTLVTRTYLIFSRTTFIANGLQFYVTPSNQTEFWDMSVLVHKINAGSI